MLRIENLSVTFKTGTPDEICVLDGIDLHVKEGSFVMVIGTNGSGKSTLLNAIAGVFPSGQGRLEVAGRDVTQWPEHRRARLIGRVFQNPFSGTAPHMTVAENLALAARRGHARGLRWALSRSLVRQMREQVRELNMGLEDRLEADIGSLSGGQRQALTLLMAAWMKPHLLLLDEHTAALDPKAADQVIRLTHQMITKNRLTTLMVTHSMAQAVNLGDRLVMMHKGRIIYDVEGSAKRSLRAENLIARFEEVRRDEQLDASAAKLLKELYV